MPMEDYATQVVAQLPARQDQTFGFVLVYPSKSAQSAEIWDAFSQLVTTCRAIEGPKKVS